MNGSITARKRACRGYSQGVCVWFDPRTVAAIDGAAAAAGLSRSDWVRRMLVKVLGGDIERPAPPVVEAPARAPRGRQLKLPLPAKRPR